jgi:hypothetical protein
MHTHSQNTNTEAQNAVTGSVSYVMNLSHFSLLLFVDDLIKWKWQKFEQMATVRLKKTFKLP